MSDINGSGNLSTIAGARIRGDEKSLPFATIGKEASKGFAPYLKIAVDMTIALVALVILMPMIVMIMTLLYVVQGRPIFISHRRIGKYGVMFPCFKFRTMVVNAEDVLFGYLAANPSERAEWAATRKLKSDPRITPLGALFRKSSIDEIPQLLNILLGHMSFVGPRPIVAAEAELYGASLVDYMQVRPGLTGPWQISGRNDISYNARVELDVRYVREHNLWGDLVIMGKTIPAVLRQHGSY